MSHEEQKSVVAFICGLLVGGLLVWIFSWSPDEEPEVEVQVVEQIVVEKEDARDNYAYCYRAARNAQNPDFWTGELENPYSQNELTAFLDDCMSRIK